MCSSHGNSIPNVSNDVNSIPDVSEGIDLVGEIVLIEEEETPSDSNSGQFSGGMVTSHDEVTLPNDVVLVGDKMNFPEVEDDCGYAVAETLVMDKEGQISELPVINTIQDSCVSTHIIVGVANKFGSDPNSPDVYNKARLEQMGYAHKLFGRMPQRDILSSSRLIFFDVNHLSFLFDGGGLNKITSLSYDSDALLTFAMSYMKTIPNVHRGFNEVIPGQDSSTGTEYANNETRICSSYLEIDILYAGFENAGWSFTLYSVAEVYVKLQWFLFYRARVCNSLPDVLQMTFLRVSNTPRGNVFDMKNQSVYTRHMMAVGTSCQYFTSLLNITFYKLWIPEAEIHKAVDEIIFGGNYVTSLLDVLPLINGMPTVIIVITIPGACAHNCSSCYSGFSIRYYFDPGVICSVFPINSRPVMQVADSNSALREEQVETVTEFALKESSLSLSQSDSSTELTYEVQGEAARLFIWSSFFELHVKGYIQEENRMVFRRHFRHFNTPTALQLQAVLVTTWVCYDGSIKLYYVSVSHGIVLYNSLADANDPVVSGTYGLMAKVMFFKVTTTNSSNGEELNSGSQNGEITQELTDAYYAHRSKEGLSILLQQFNMYVQAVKLSAEETPIRHLIASSKVATILIARMLLEVVIVWENFPSSVGLLTIIVGLSGTAFYWEFCSGNVRCRDRYNQVDKVQGPGSNIMQYWFNVGLGAAASYQIERDINYFNWTELLFDGITAILKVQVTVNELFQTQLCYCVRAVNPRQAILPMQRGVLILSILADGTRVAAASEFRAWHFQWDHWGCIVCVVVAGAVWVVDVVRKTSMIGTTGLIFHSWIALLVAEFQALVQLRSHVCPQGSTAIFVVALGCYVYLVGESSHHCPIATWVFGICCTTSMIHHTMAKCWSREQSGTLAVSVMTHPSMQALVHKGCYFLPGSQLVFKDTTDIEHHTSWSKLQSNMTVTNRYSYLVVLWMAKHNRNLYDQAPLSCWVKRLHRNLSEVLVWGHVSCSLMYGKYTFCFDPGISWLLSGAPWVVLLCRHMDWTEYSILYQYSRKGIIIWIGTFTGVQLIILLQSTIAERKTDLTVYWQAQKHDSRQWCHENGVKHNQDSTDFQETTTTGIKLVQQGVDPWSTLVGSKVCHVSCGGGVNSLVVFVISVIKVAKPLWESHADSVLLGTCIVQLSKSWLYLSLRTRMPKRGGHCHDPTA